VPTNQDVGIEMYVYVHDTAGIIRVWQDGLLIIEATDIDTRQPNNFNQIGYGCVVNAGDIEEAKTYYFDEVYVQDEQKIVAAGPAGPARFNPLNLRRFGGL
jgi:hypothetical protein